MSRRTRSVRVISPVLAIAGVLAWALAGPTSAYATDKGPDHVWCVFTGLAGTATSRDTLAVEGNADGLTALNDVGLDGTTNGVESAMQEAKEIASNDLESTAGPLPPDDTGTYTFAGNSSQTICDVVDAGVNHPNPPDRAIAWYNATIESRGTYDNVVCGTSGQGSVQADTGLTKVTPGVAPLAVPPPEPNAAANPSEGPYSDTGATGDPTYAINFVVGSGPIVINHIADNNGDVGRGGGTITIAPEVTGPPPPLTAGDCVTAPVTAFTVAGSFAVDFAR